MTDQDQILDFLKYTGPTLPAKVAKKIGLDTLLASAHLADLKSRGKVNISNLKIGASPLYFLPGQEEQLYNFAAGNINPKELIVLNKLKNKKLLRETDLELLEKVALRSLKDFAVPLHVTLAGKKELFWKWHLLSGEETNLLLKEMFVKPEPVKEVVIEKEEEKQEEKEEQEEKVEEKKDTAEEVVKEKVVDEEKQYVEIKEEQEKVVEKEAEVEEKDLEPLSEDDFEVEEKEEVKEESKEKTEKKKTVEEKKEERQKKLSEEKKAEIKEEKKEKEIKENKEEPEEKEVKEKPLRKKRKSAPDKFIPIIEDFFKNLNINIEENETVRKNFEHDMLVSVPSVVGRIKYFCKTKKKSKCDEKDLSAAYMQAQIKKLPLLFVYTNELTKKAQEMFETGAFENAILKKIE